MGYLLALLVGLAVAAPAYATSWASVAVTPGHGRIEIVSNYLIFSSGRSYDARIPEVVETGSRINISYRKNGEWVRRTFNVMAISTDGNLCRLHDQMPTMYSTSTGDTIYVKPCRYR